VIVLNVFASVEIPANIFKKRSSNINIRIFNRFYSTVRRQIILTYFLSLIMYHFRYIFEYSVEINDILL